MRNLTTAIVAAALVSVSTATAQPTNEQKLKMAEMHEKMAGCLRSEKSVEQCHEEMRAACQDSDFKCPMSEMRSEKMKRKMKRDILKGESTPTSDKQ